MRVESPLIHGDEGEVEPVFALEHALLVRQLEQRRRPERRADGEQRQRRLLRFAILSVQHFDAAPNVQSLRKKGEQKKNQSSKTKCRRVRGRASDRYPTHLHTDLGWTRLDLSAQVRST